jgi:hypothetical protein
MAKMCHSDPGVPKNYLVSSARSRARAGGHHQEWSLPSPSLPSTYRARINQKKVFVKIWRYYPNDYHIELVINSNPSIQYDVNPGALFGDNRRKHGKVESRNKPCYRRLGEAMLTHDNYSSYT